MCNYTRRGAVGSGSRLVIGGYLSVVRLSPIKGPRCFLEQETLLSLLRTGWFQERIREVRQAEFHSLFFYYRWMNYVWNLKIATFFYPTFSIAHIVVLYSIYNMARTLYTVHTIFASTNTNLSVCTYKTALPD